MCSPDSLQGLSMGANAMGTISNMNAASNEASYKASIANQNAAIAEAQAVSAGQQGTNEQIQIRQKAKQITGSQKTVLSANGLDIQAGSPLSIIADTAQQSEQDAQTSRYNTAMQMWGLNNQANQYRAEASNAIQAGKNARTSSLLNGITSAVKMYSSYKNP